MADKMTQALRSRRNERLYALLRGMREVPEPTSGMRVGALSYNESKAYDAIVVVMDSYMGEIGTLRDQLAILRALARSLIEAAEPFCSGRDWGRVKAWMVNGAPAREEGIALAREQTKNQAALDVAVHAARTLVEMFPEEK